MGRCLFGKPVELVRIFQNLLHRLPISQHTDLSRGSGFVLPAGGEDMPDKGIGGASDGQAVFGAADPLQGKIHRLGRAAAVFAGLPVPEGKQNVAVGRDIDPGLPVGIVPAAPFRRQRFAARRHKDLLSPGAVMIQAPLPLRTEVFFVLPAREGQRCDQRNAEFLRCVGTHQVGPFRQAAKHHQRRMRVLRLQGTQLINHRRFQRRKVLRPQSAMPGHTDDNRYFLFGIL